MDNELPDGPIIEVGDWVRYRTHTRGIEIAEVRRIMHSDCNPYYMLSSNYSVTPTYILEVRKKGTP